MACNKFATSRNGGKSTGTIYPHIQYLYIKCKLLQFYFILFALLLHTMAIYVMPFSTGAYRV